MASRHPLALVESFALVALGGFAGANARYAAGLVLPPLQATLAVNVAGSFVLGFVLYEAAYVGEFSDPMRVALGTGFLSSLTTYSTFAVQTAFTPEWALANVVANYTLGLMAVFGGRALALSVGGGR